MKDAGITERNERLMGIDLPNGLTYLGMTTNVPGDSVFLLKEYLVVDTRKIGKMANTYKEYNKEGSELRID